MRLINNHGTLGCACPVVSQTHQGGPDVTTYTSLMGKFLAILHGGAGPDKDQLTDEQQSEFMTAWATWAQAHEEALLDPGSPLYRKKRVTSTYVEDFEDSKIAYALVDAPSHDAAAQMFKDHPHVGLHDGNSIEVIECPVIPS